MFAAWLPQLWSHVNKYIETYNSIDVTIGPARLFTTYPDDEVERVREWLIDLWNNQLVPMLGDVVREGVELYGGRKDFWEDPSNWVEATCPLGPIDCRFDSVRAVDVGLASDNEEAKTSPLRKRISAAARSTASSRNSNENDKLINMLMRLQEVTGIQYENNDILTQKTSMLSLAQKSIESSLWLSELFFRNLLTAVLFI